MARKMLRFASISILWLLFATEVQFSHAETYHIGSGQAEDATHFNDLESLFTAHPALNNDTVIMYQSDSSLTKHASFTVGGTVSFRADTAGKSITINGQNIADRLFDVNGTLNISKDFTIANFNSSNNGTMTILAGGTLNAEGVTYLNNSNTGLGAGGVDAAVGNTSPGQTKMINLRGAHFEGNTGTWGGGVRVIGVDAADFTDAMFIDNITESQPGGAIRLVGQAVVTIGASAGGYSRFEGNYSNATNRYNSLYCVGFSTGIGNIDLSIVTGKDGVLDLLDPIYIAENTLFEAYIVKKGEGTWNLGGVTEINTGQGTTNLAKITIEEGTLRLLEGTEIHMTGNRDSFTAKAASTVTIDGGNVLEGTTVIFEPGAILNFDMDFYHVKGNPLSTPMLYLDGNTLEVAGTYININKLPDGPAGYGDYILIEGASALDAGDFVLHINGKEIDISGKVSKRFGYSLGNTEDVKQLVLHIQALENTILRWQNYESQNTDDLGDQWSIYGKNWDLMYTDPIEIDSFVPGDTVVFDLSGKHTVTLTEPGVIGANAKPAGQPDGNFYVANQIGMHVDGDGDWIFAGKGITDAYDPANPDPSRKAGLLFSGSGTLSLRNASPNTYSGDTVITGGGTLSVPRGDLLGTGEVVFRNAADNPLSFNGTLNYSGTSTHTQRIVSEAGSSGRVTVDYRKTLTMTGSADTPPAQGAIAMVSGHLDIRGYEQLPSVFVSDNSATTGGAVFVDGTGLLETSYVDFTKNAADDVGGAVAIEGGTMQDTGSRFTQNTANHGGAISVQNSGAMTTTGSTFDRNEAVENGGAIFGNAANVTVTNATFTGNKADGLGGAIHYSGQTLTVAATAGNTTSFSGNSDQDGANSIHLAATTGTTTAVIHAEANGTVDMRDPFSAAADGGTNVIEKTGQGVWKLAGNNRLVVNGGGSNSLTVKEGTLAFYANGQLDLTGTMAVEAGGALQATGGNTIAATSINLASGATLAFDMTGVNPDNTPFSTMTATNWNTNNWTQNVDLRNFTNPTILDDSERIFNLTTVDASANLTPENMTLMYRGTKISGLRENFGTLLKKDDGSGETLYVKLTAPANGTTTWENKSGNMTWDASTRNWNGTALGETNIDGTDLYMYGDAVRFFNTGSGVVTVNSNGVEIANQRPLGSSNDAPASIPGMLVENTTGHDYTFKGGSIDGTGSLVKDGAGTLTFADQNGFTGGTTIKAGKVVAQKASSLGTGDIQIDDAAILEFAVQASGSGTVAQKITGGGKLVKSENGSVKLATENSYWGGTEIQGGRLILGSVRSAGTNDVVTGIDNTHFGELVFEGATGQFGNRISGSGSVTVSGTETTGYSDISFNGTNTYTGTTRVDRGSKLTVDGLAATGTGNFWVDGTFALNQAQDIALGKRTLSGNGTIQKYKAGELSISGSNLFLGTFEQREGGVRLLDSSALGYATLAYWGGTVSFDKLTKVTLGGLAGNRNIALANDSGQTVNMTIGTNDSDQTYSGNLSGRGSLTKVGLGTQTFTGNNSDFSGKVDIEGGRLVAVGVNAIGTGNVLNNGELEFRINGGNETYGKAIAGTGALFKSGGGTLELSGANTYSGGTTVKEGTLYAKTLAGLGLNRTPTAKNDGTVRVEGTGILALDLANDETITRDISGDGTVLKNGDGVLTIDADLSHLGLFDIRQGTVYINGTTHSSTIIHAGATLSGAGMIDNTVLFKNGAVHRIGEKEDAGLGLFEADKIEYEGGSTIYIKVGQNGADRVVADDSINFAKDGGTVNVVLVNLGVAETGDTEGHHTFEVFHSEAGKLLLNGQRIGDVTGTNSLSGAGGELCFVSDPDEGISVIQYAVQSTGGLSRGLFLDLSVRSADFYFTENQRNTLYGLKDAAAYDTIYRYGKDVRGDLVDQLMPMISSAFPYLTNRAVTQFNAATFERLRFLREPAGTTTGARPDETYRGNSGKELMNYVWFQNYGDFLTMGGGGDGSSFRADTYGFNLGIDQAVDVHSAIGIGFGGYFSNVRATGYRQKGDVDSFLISVYGDWVGVGGWTWTASSGFVLSSYETERNAAAFDTNLKGKHDGTSYHISVETTRKFQWGQYELSPYIGLDGIFLWEDGYRENASGNENLALNVKKRYTGTVLSSAGLRLGRTFRLLGGNLVTPSVYAAWIHDYSHGNIFSSASFMDGPVFSVRGASAYRDRAQVGVNANMTLNSRMDMFGRLNAELGNHLSDLTFHWGIRYGY